MRALRCTIDSSCVIALDHLDLVPQLSFLFSVVLVPRAVREEVFKDEATEERLQVIFGSYAFFKPCDSYEQGTVDFLLAEHDRRGAEDRGEVEAVVQASQVGATVIVDDAWGRKLAKRYDLEFHGTFWVLERFHELKLLSAGALRDSFVSLQHRGMRLPWQAVNDLLVRIGQRPL
jgi:predicted nucleic acid-binding protein